ncbi:LOW QUALITY PROTEIN: hypothetical protein HID58_043109 [Brassica napus]|uniref:Uncharacterized protein n=1 Tax=Brassica napus TaxID=3708 RepID=A0ABQ8BHC5_BRANA|nr:LOW QUALITY PROTEIN: hypothetical protein HID58_043109 [Brassica napus]
MIGDSDGDSGSKEIAKEKGDGGLLEITDLGVSQRKEVGRGGSPVRRSEAVDIGLKKVAYSAALVDGNLGLDLQPDFVVKEGVAEVSIPEEVCFVAGYFMNDAPHIRSIHATVNMIWNLPGKKSKIDVQFIGKMTVLFRIEDAARSSSAIVTKLLTELESLSGRENLSSKPPPPPVEDVDQLSSEQQEIKEKEWDLVTLKNGGMASPGKVVKAVEGYTSSNGFQILQDLREESEINEDDVDDEADDEVEGGVGAVVEAEDAGARGIVDQVVGNTTVTASLTEVVETKDLIIPPKHSSSTRGRGRGSKRLIFLEVVERAWNESPPLFHSPSALGMFQEKLKALKFDMRGLNKDLYGDLPGPASDAWEHWHHISGIEEQFFYQKSRVQWLGLGDRNSIFFYKVTQNRNVRNTIRRIVTGDGLILTAPADIKMGAAAHFESFLNGSTPPGQHVSQEEIKKLH